MGRVNIKWERGRERHGIGHIQRVELALVGAAEPLRLCEFDFLSESLSQRFLVRFEWCLLGNAQKRRHFLLNGFFVESTILDGQAVFLGRTPQPVSLLRI